MKIKVWKKSVILFLIIMVVMAFGLAAGSCRLSRIENTGELPEPEESEISQRKEDIAETSAPGPEGMEQGGEDNPYNENVLPDSPEDDPDSPEDDPDSPEDDPDSPESGESFVFEGDYILPESNTRRYILMELYEYIWKPSDAVYGRNEIFARHGHIFDNEKYANYFKGKAWYKPSGKVAFEDLNEYERYNVKLLLFYEKGYQGAYPPGTDIPDPPQNPEWLIKTLKPDEEFMVDMDGDGNEDTVSWARSFEAEAIITVNNISLTIPEYNSGNWAEYAHILDLDPNDAYMELIVCDEGPSNDEWTYYLEYSSGSINLIGETAGYLDYGSLRPDGEGGVIASTRASILQTWFYDKSFKLDNKHRLQPVPQDYYNTAYQVFLCGPIHLSEKRDSQSPKFKVDDGQAALLSATDDIRWCRLTLEDGTEGWFEVKDFSTIVYDNKNVGEIFDNICNAD